MEADTSIRNWLESQTLMSCISHVENSEPNNRFIHPYGFAVIRTSVQMFPGWQIRIHVWPASNSISDEAPALGVHSHGWSIKSKVLVGQIRETQYSVKSSDQPTHTLYEVQSSYTTGSSILTPTSNKVVVVKKSTEIRSAESAILEIDPLMFHSSASASGGVSVTFVATSNNTNCPSRVVGPIGSPLIYKARRPIPDISGLVANITRTFH